MCSRQNLLGKGGLNAKAKFSKPCVFDVDDVTHQILKDYIARCVECDFLPLIPDGTMYEINQYREYAELSIVLTRKH